MEVIAKWQLDNGRPFQTDAQRSRYKLMLGTGPLPYYPLFSSEVHLGGRLLAERLVRSCGVVEAKIADQAGAQLRSVA